MAIKRNWMRVANLNFARGGGEAGHAHSCRFLMALLGGLLELKRKLSEVRKIKLYVKLCVKSCVKCAKCAIGAIDKQPAQFNTWTTNLTTNRDNKFLMHITRRVFIFKFKILVECLSPL